MNSAASAVGDVVVAATRGDSVVQCMDPGIASVAPGVGVNGTTASTDNGSNDGDMGNGASDDRSGGSDGGGGNKARKTQTGGESPDTAVCSDPGTATLGTAQCPIVLSPDRGVGQAVKVENTCSLCGKSLEGYSLLVRHSSGVHDGVMTMAMVVMCMCMCACVCVGVFAVQSAQLHVNACLDGGGDTSMMGGASSDVRCVVCGKDLAPLSMNARLGHTNRCLDGVGLSMAGAALGRGAAKAKASGGGAAAAAASTAGRVAADKRPSGVSSGDKGNSSAAAKRGRSTAATDDARATKRANDGGAVVGIPANDDGTDAPPSTPTHSHPQHPRKLGYIDVHVGGGPRFHRWCFCAAVSL